MRRTRLTPFACALAGGALALALCAAARGSGPRESRPAAGGGAHAVGAGRQEQPLTFPALLKQQQQRAGNPLAAYAEMLRLEPQYLKSKVFARVYPEVRANYEEFLG